MEGETEWMGAFDEIGDKGRIRRKVVPPDSRQYIGFVERRITMLEAIALAARPQANSLL